MTYDKLLNHCDISEACAIEAVLCFITDVYGPYLSDEIYSEFCQLARKADRYSNKVMSEMYEMKA